MPAPLRVLLRPVSAPLCQVLVEAHPLAVQAPRAQTQGPVRMVPPAVRVRPVVALLQVPRAPAHVLWALVRVPGPRPAGPRYMPTRTRSGSTRPAGFRPAGFRSRPARRRTGRSGTAVGAETVGWIEARGAKAGVDVELLPDKKLWTVVEVYDRGVPEELLKEHQRLNRNSLPSIERMH